MLMTTSSCSWCSSPFPTLMLTHLRKWVSGAFRAWDASGTLQSGSFSGSSLSSNACHKGQSCGAWCHAWGVHTSCHAMHTTRLWLVLPPPSTCPPLPMPVAIPSPLPLSLPLAYHILLIHQCPSLHRCAHFLLIAHHCPAQHTSHATGSITALALAHVSITIPSFTALCLDPCPHYSLTEHHGPDHMCCPMTHVTVHPFLILSHTRSCW